MANYRGIFAFFSSILVKFLFHPGRLSFYFFASNSSASTGPKLTWVIQTALSWQLEMEIRRMDEKQMSVWGQVTGDK